MIYLRPRNGWFGINKATFIYQKLLVKYCTDDIKCSVARRLALLFRLFIIQSEDRKPFLVEKAKEESNGCC